MVVFKGVFEGDSTQQENLTKPDPTEKQDPKELRDLQQKHQAIIKHYRKIDDARVKATSKKQAFLKALEAGENDKELLIQLVQMIELFSGDAVFTQKANALIELKFINN